MIVKFKIEFDKNHTEKVNIKICETSLEEAPIAFIVKLINEGSINIRTYKGQLYREARVSFYNGVESTEYNLEDIKWEHVLGKYQQSGELTTKAEYVAHLKLKSREYLLIDGVLYQKCYEPFYKIQTLGPKGGGTSIIVEFSDKSRKVVEGYSALHEKQVVNDAIKVAKCRDDFSSIPFLENLSAGRIQVKDTSKCRRLYKPQSNLWEKETDK